MENSLNLSPLHNMDNMVGAATVDRSKNLITNYINSVHYIQPRVGNFSVHGLFNLCFNVLSLYKK